MLRRLFCTLLLAGGLLVAGPHPLVNGVDAIGLMVSDLDRSVEFYSTVDARSNDRWFQHVAIIVSDIDRAYQWLREHKVQHASPGPQLLPAWNPNAGGIRAFYFRDPDGHPLEVLWF